MGGWLVGGTLRGGWERRGVVCLHRVEIRAEFLCAAAKAYLTLLLRKAASVASASTSSLRTSSSSSPLDTHTRGTDPPSTSSHFWPMCFSNFLDDKSRRMCDTATLDRPCSCAPRDQSSLTWLTNSSYFVKTKMRGTQGEAECKPPKKKRCSSSVTERPSSLATQYHTQWIRSSCFVEDVARELKKSRMRS